jgi:hypothetical protein
VPDAHLAADPICASPLAAAAAAAAATAQPPARRWVARAWIGSLTAAGSTPGRCQPLPQGGGVADADFVLYVTASSSHAISQCSDRPAQVRKRAVTRGGTCGAGSCKPRHADASSHFALECTMWQEGKSEALAAAGSCFRDQFDRPIGGDTVR